jgi:hypothetical protein|tara:strand:+ start:2728 stop:2988 length:261 start_codon:yes stop_codon:yes gene_type:complete
MDIKMISCRTCGEDMPELRLTKYNYTFCVKCSESGIGDEAKKGISVLMGEGDHTWVETVIVNEEKYKQITNPDGNPEITFGLENTK